MTSRNTIQCSLVLDAVNRLQCHASAVEVYDEVVREYPNISKGTVYRNLNHLSQTGKIQKIEIPGAADRFDHRCQKHYHIVCEKCGRVFDVDMDVIEDMNEKIKETHGFEFTSYDIIFKGICPECKQ